MHQPAEVVMTATVGDVVLSTERTSDLPNAFGGADIFGRQKAEGGTVVIYNGLSNGEVVFARNDVMIESNETTMTRGSGLLIPNRSTTTMHGMAGSTPFYGQATTTTGYNYIPPPEATVQTKETGWRTLTTSADPGSVVWVSGRGIEIIEATRSTLTYQIFIAG